MILFVQDDGKWKVVNLTNINDFLIAMTSFLKSDKSTRGEGDWAIIRHRRCRGFEPSLIIIGVVKQIQMLFYNPPPSLCDPAYWSTAPSYEAPGIISKVISQV